MTADSVGLVLVGVYVFGFGLLAYAYMSGRWNQ